MTDYKLNLPVSIKRRQSVYLMRCISLASRASTWWPVETGTARCRDDSVHNPAESADRLAESNPSHSSGEMNPELPFYLLCAIIILDAQHPAELPPPDAVRRFPHAGAWSRRLMGSRYLLGDAGNNWDSSANPLRTEAGADAPLVGSKGCCRLCWLSKM
ncbi:hypothetical protein V8C26DRAFT_313611 [Trichoderma gracile]